MPQLLHRVRDLIEDLADEAAFSMTAGPRGLSEQDAERATQPWEKLLDEVNDDQERAADLCESAPALRPARRHVPARHPDVDAVERAVLILSTGSAPAPSL